MSGKKKSDKQDTATKLIILLTAILNLIIRLIEMIDRMTE